VKKNTRKRVSSSFETRAAHAPQDEETLHAIALGKGSFVLATDGVFGEDASLPRAGNFFCSGASSAE
jgi:hypothetical protein